MKTSYQVEPELQNSVRQAHWTAEARMNRQALLGVVVAIVLIGGSIAFYDLSGLYALLQHGKTVAAQVTGKHESHGKSTSYRIDYRFNGGGKQMDASDEVSRLQYQSTGEGGTVMVTYLPSNPSVHRVGNVDARRLTAQEWFWGLVVGGIAGVFVLAIVATEYGYRRQMRLAVSGVPMVGKIVSCAPPPSGSKNPTYTVKYAFVDLGGSARTGVLSVSEVLGEQLRPDMDVTVLCDPNNPKHFKMYRALNAVEVEGAVDQDLLALNASISSDETG